MTHSLRVIRESRCAKSHKIGRANCLRGELSSTIRLRIGIAPKEAASSWRTFDSRQRLNKA